MKITDDRARDLLRWLDDMAGDHTMLFDEMARYRDAAALIRQLQAAEQAAWHAGLDAGREQGRSKDHAPAPPSAPVGVEELMQLAREWCLSWGEWAHDSDPDCEKENAAEAALRAALTAALAQQPAACPKCGGTGEADSGGIMPWGAPAMIPCDCKQPAAVDGEVVRRIEGLARRWQAAEIEALRVEVAAQRTRADAMAGEAIKHEARAEALRAEVERLTQELQKSPLRRLQETSARAERLAEALRDAKEKMLAQVKWVACDCGCERDKPADAASVAWIRAADMLNRALLQEQEEGK